MHLIFEFALILNIILNNLVQPCEIKPCKNNGVCVNEEGGRFTCKCKEGFGGTFCDRIGQFVIQQVNEPFV